MYQQPIHEISLQRKEDINRTTAWRPGLYSQRFVVIAVIVTAIVSMVFSVSLGRILWPRKIETKVLIEKKSEAPVEQKQEKKFNSKDWQWEISSEADHIASQRMSQLFKENNVGVLIIKDGEASTVAYKQAAAVGKTGFTHFSKGTELIVYHYHVYNGVGRGVSLEKHSKNLVLVEWHTGATRPPDVIPEGVIHILSGKKIGLGSNIN